MSFAKQPTQAPQFDAGAFAKHAGITAADIKNFQAWKQWCEASLAFDGTGLRDVVAANAIFLNAVKADVDADGAAIMNLTARVAAVEARPAVPFPGLWSLDGLRKGRWTPEWLALEARLQGYRWIVAQHEEMTPELSTRLQAACVLQGLRCGVWESLPDYGSMLRRASEGWDALVVQIEGDGQMDRVLQSVGPFRDLYPDMPAAVITNFGGISTPALAAPLIGAGLSCLVECFIAENPMSTPERQVDYATRVLGWPSAQPMLGLGGGLTLDAYPTGKTFAGWSCWAAEFIYG